MVNLIGDAGSTRHEYIKHLKTMSRPSNLITVVRDGRSIYTITFNHYSPPPHRCHTLGI